MVSSKAASSTDAPARRDYSFGKKWSGGLAIRPISYWLMVRERRDSELELRSRKWLYALHEELVKGGKTTSGVRYNKKYQNMQMILSTPLL